MPPDDRIIIREEHVTSLQDNTWPASTEALAAELQLLLEPFSKDPASMASLTLLNHVQEAYEYLARERDRLRVHFADVYAAIGLCITLQKATDHTRGRLKAALWNPLDFSKTTLLKQQLKLFEEEFKDAEAELGRMYNKVADLGSSTKVLRPAAVTVQKALIAHLPWLEEKCIRWYAQLLEGMRTLEKDLRNYPYCAEGDEA